MRPSLNKAAPSAPFAPSRFIPTIGKTLILINGAASKGWSDEPPNRREAEITMVHLKAGKMLLTALVVGLGLSGSFDWTPTEGLSLSVGGAQARVGRPLTPVSVAGVARRTTRRAVVGGAAVGAAAVGTVCVHRVLVNGVYVCR